MSRTAPTKVRFGILGTAAIARAFLGQRFVHAEITAIASRDITKANAFADDAGIAKRFGSYEALLNDPEIDAVYIPLPHHLHAEFTIRAAQSRKHVLVEKPAAISSAEVEQMTEACLRNGVLLMEGFMYRFRSAHLRAKELVTNGALGELRYANFAWSQNIVARLGKGFRLDNTLGGGCLSDLGVYGVDWIRFITGSEPHLISASITRNALGLDVLAHATYHSGKTIAMMTCGYSSDVNYYFLGCEHGSIYSPVSLSGRFLPNVLHIHRTNGDRREVEEFQPENTYALELEYFAQCIKENRQPFLDGENARRNLCLLEELESRAVQL